MPARPGRTSGSTKSYFIPKVEVDPKNPDIVFVAAEGKLYDNEMDCERGLFKSIDGGKTWTNIFASVANDRGVGDFVIDPRNSNVIIAAAYKHYRRAWTYDDRDPGNGIYKTTNGGKTWTKLTAGLPAAGTPLGRIGLAIYDKNPNILYARVDQGVSIGFPEQDGVANFRAGGAGGRAGGAGRGGFGAAGRDTAVQDRFHVRAVQGLQDQPGDRRARAEVHAGHRRRRGGAGQEVHRARAGQGLRGQERRGRGEARRAAARRIYAGNQDLMTMLNEVEALMKKPAAAPDSTEARARTQIVNRHVLEILYAGALSNLAPTTRNGMVYRTDDQGKTWKAMTEYKHPAPGAGGRGAPGAVPTRRQSAAAARLPAGCRPGCRGARQAAPRLEAAAQPRPAAPR